MSKLSIFVDESGDFGEYQIHSPYYIVTLIFHDQKYDISENVLSLNHSLQALGYRSDFVIHTEPLIRKKDEYFHLSPNERRGLFTNLFVFLKKSHVSYKTFVFLKRDFETPLKLQGRISRELSLFIRDNLNYFQSFEKVILYYDNGQHELTQILNTVLATEIPDFDVRKVLPKDYKLFQAADLICTLALMEKKIEDGTLSRSDLLIFHNPRDLKKQYLNPLLKKQFQKKDS